MSHWFSLTPVCVTMAMENIKGYDPALGRSPITVRDLESLEKTLLWSSDDDRFLNLAGEVLQD